MVGKCPVGSGRLCVGTKAAKRAVSHGKKTAFADVRPHIRGRIRPFASEASGKFDSIDQLFDKATGAKSMNNPGGKLRQ